MIIYSVTQLNNQARYTIETKFKEIWVRGEITSLNTYPSGHTYFSIRDNSSELSAVLFNSDLKNIICGSKVIIKGKLSIYSNKGRYQFIAQEYITEGEGELWLKYKELKAKLNKEGLFDNNKKLFIPKIPKDIGILTSEKGAVVWDMINFFKKQNIKLNFILNHCSVQGESACNEIISGIENLERLDVDIIIIARGGGSMEDLWCFNDERLIRKISNLSIPLISAIGHETDYTLCDLVSDFRAPTPSYAAELIARNYHTALMEIDDFIGNIKYNTELTLKFYYEKLNSISIENTIRIFHQEIKQLVDKNLYYYNQMLQWITYIVDSKKLSLNFYNSNFKLNHPDKILERGYAVVKNINKRTISYAEKLKIKDEVYIKFIDGIVRAKIKQIQRVNEE